jgi:putative peptide zinc metalloprotease protein
MTAVLSTPDLSFLSVVEDSPDDFVVGNGKTFINVPGIAAAVIGMLDGTRTVAQVHEMASQIEGTDVDVAGFVADLDTLGLLTAPTLPTSRWDRIQPRHAAWLFSWPTSALTALLVIGAGVTLVRKPGLAPFRYHDIVAGNSSLVFILTCVVAGWFLVSIHEFSHILAARSLDVRAELSFGTRQQFLVAQTNVTGIWQVPKRRRYRVHLAGLRTDLALLSAATCLLPLIHNAHLASAIRVLTMIWLSQIAWQFLFFMRTDIYYAYANLVGSKSLMDEARSYLHSVLRRRRESAPAAVRAYSWFLVVGQILGISYFAGYTIPVTVTVFREALTGLSQAPAPGKAEALAALLIIGASWGLLAFLLLRSARRRLTRRPASADAAC